VWCREEAGMRRHSRTRRLPREHFEAVEKPALLPAPTTRYDIPIHCEPKVARDQHAQVARALYSLPRRYVGKTLHARADRTTVRFYDGAELVKTHLRMPPGGRSTDREDFPAERSAYALRDVVYLEREAHRHGEAIGAYARSLLAVPLPWTRMRRVYALLHLVKRYGAERVEEACRAALAVDLVDVTRLKRVLAIAAPAEPTIDATVATSATPTRFLRPSSEYRLAPSLFTQEQEVGR
ncbi:MAG TPA: IS21 family transposase, partial [Candidatus Binatia bacterium]|nr:IS21 family transposase [Candidatus Binatia bacterium]